MYIAHVLPFSDQPAQGRYSLAGEHPIVCNGLIDDECGGHPLFAIKGRISIVIFVSLRVSFLLQPTAKVS